jgi:RNA polymerase sigma-54 factor
MVMTPMLQQAMKILQLSTLELKEWVDKEMLENPVLEEEIEDPVSADTADKTSPLVSSSAASEEQAVSESQLLLDRARQRHETDLVEHLKEGGRFENDTWALYSEAAEYGDAEGEWGGRESSGEAQEKRDFVEASITRSPSLADNLEWQLMMATPDEQQQVLGKVIIGNLDENGYLTCPLEDIAESQNVSLSQVEKILSLIQTFDPAGVGARNLRECLLLQLENQRGEMALKAFQVVDQCFEDMEKRKYPPILKALGCTPEQLREILRFISTLEPKPGRSFEPDDTKYIVPDVYVRKVEGEYVILLNDDPVPKLRISPYYRKLLKDKNASNVKETKAFLENKIQSALWLIKNIEQRRKTIYRVTESIFKIQRGFLEEGVSALKPLTLKQVADMIGMHESTVSRVTTHKYVETHRGLFELKYFFTSGLESADGMDVSSLSVKEKIKELVEQESSQKPFSDEKITQVLKEQGLSIARRTIAKYREELRIPPASQRRKL